MPPAPQPPPALPLPRAVKDIIIHQKSDEGVGAYKLRFFLAESDVKSTYPETWGSDKPLERARLALLRLRDDALEGHSH